MMFGLFNVITALYVDNILAAAKFDNLHQKRSRLMDAQMFATKIVKLVKLIWRLHRHRDRDRGSARNSLSPENLDELSDIQITTEFFDELRSFKEFRTLLAELDVSDEDQLDLFSTLDVDGGGTIDLEELVVGICKLRGDARRSDIVGVSLIARSIQMAMARFEVLALRAHRRGQRCQ